MGTLKFTYTYIQQAKPVNHKINYETVSKCVFLLLAYLMHAQGGQWVTYRDCGSRAKIMWIEVEPCDERRNCTLKRGGETTLQIRFAPRKPVTKITAVMQDKTRHEYVPHPLDNPNGCKHSGLTCPLQPKKRVIYIQKFHTRKNADKTNIDVRFQLRDQNGNDLVCAIMKFHIDDTTNVLPLWEDDR